MQSAFYTSYTAARRALDFRAAAGRKRLQSAQADIEAGLAEPTDFARASAIHKAVMEFAMLFCSADAAVSGLAPARAMDVATYLGAVQREFGVALESVLPRASVVHFGNLPRDERGEQLEELARIVLGIRLYTWESGKGGTGLEHTPSLAMVEATALASELQLAVTAAVRLCERYVDVLGAVRSGLLQATPEEAAAWTVELANRRSVVVLTSALLADATSTAAALAAAVRTYNAELADVRQITSGARGAVAKEDVYPGFRALAGAWATAAEGRLEIAELRAVAETMRSFAPAGTVSTLPFETAVAALRATGGAASAAFARAEEPPAEGEKGERLDPRTLRNASLELSGYCPVALSSPVGSGSSSGPRLGPLVPGSCGVAFNGRLYATATPAAAASFAAAPRAYLSAVRPLALAHPELVHLLDLLSGGAPEGGALFPLASMSMLATYDGDTEAVAAHVAAAASASEAAPLSSTTRLGATGRVSAKSGRATVDVGVETPTHFVERHIDPTYEFSEWGLRRAALKIANIRKCVTHGAQTDGSAFRRENETQVYLPRESGTQTGISTAAQTDTLHVHNVGLRGCEEPFIDAAAANQRAGKPVLGEAGSKAVPHPGPAVAMRRVAVTVDASAMTVGLGPKRPV
jgi:hypothetical protein